MQPQTQQPGLTLVQIKELKRQEECRVKNLKAKAGNLRADIRAAFYRCFPENVPMQGKFATYNALLRDCPNDNLINKAWDFANGGYRDVIDIILADYLKARSADQSLSWDDRAISAGLAERFRVTGLSILDPENRELRNEIYQFLKTI